MSFPYTVQLNYGDEKKTYAAVTGNPVGGSIHPIGTRGMLPDGRVFYFALNGGTALEGAQIAQSFAPLVGVQGSTTQFVSIGATVNSAATTITLLAATAFASQVFQYGYLMVQTTPARGLHKIVNQPATGSSLGIELTLSDTDPLLFPVTTAHRLGLAKNPYSSVIVAPGALTSGVVGVTQSRVAANRWFWLQTAGPAMVEYNNGFQAAEAGHAIVADSSVAGSFAGFPNSSALPLTTGASSQTDQLDQPIIGWVDGDVGADAIGSFVHLNIRA